MTIQLGTTLRDNMMNQYESTIGASPKLQLRTGAQPANCAAADSGTLLAELTLPADWMNASSSGTITKLGTWTVNGSVAGTAGHYRLKNNAGAVTHEQGSVGVGTGDLQVDQAVVAVGQPVTITAWNRTQSGA